MDRHTEDGMNHFGLVQSREEIAAEASNDKMWMTIAALRKDLEDWRKGVDLIATAVGLEGPGRLSCAAIAELAYIHRGYAQAARKLLDADHYDHFQVRTSDGEMSAIRDMMELRKLEPAPASGATNQET